MAFERCSIRLEKANRHVNGNRGPHPGGRNGAPPIAAGQTLLTTYSGTAFAVGYFLSGLAMLVVSTVMLRGKVFSRLTGLAGVLAGVTGLVPASFGTLGFVLSFISLLPLVVWLALVGQRFLRPGFAAEAHP
jgi:hypothetical protein